MPDQTLPVVAFLESRAGEQMGTLISRMGAQPLHAPALAEQPDVDLDQLRDWLARWELAKDPVVIFQTGVGVEALWRSFEQLGLQADFQRLLARSVVAVRGPKPTVALRKQRVRIDLNAASPFTSETLLHALRDICLQGRDVYVQRHGGHNPELMEALRMRGSRVMEITAYRWSLPTDTAPLDRLLTALNAREVRTLVLTSASQIQNLVAHAEACGQRNACLAGIGAIDVLSVGPVCSAAARAFGIHVTAEANPPKLGPLMELLKANLAKILFT